jgi:hypothetical protein
MENFHHLTKFNISRKGKRERHKHTSQSPKHDCCVKQLLISLCCSDIDISTTLIEISNETNFILKELVLQMQ